MTISNFKLYVGAALLMAAFVMTSIYAWADGEPVNVGTGSMKANALLQPWFVTDSSNLSAHENFRIRRFELKLSGSTTESTRWWGVVDFAKSPSVGAAATSDNKVLQDLGVALLLPYNFEIALGQFKLPATIEGGDNSGDLILPERSFVARYYGERRDAGVMLTYKDDRIKVSGMVSNGSNASGAASANQNEVNNTKDTTGRVDIGIFDKMLNIGLFATSGLYGTNSALIYRGFGGADMRLKWERLTTTIIYVQGKSNSFENTGTSFDINYRFADEMSVAARTESFIDKAVTDNISTASTFGLSYYFKGSTATRLQLSHSLLKGMLGGYGTYTQSSGDRDETVTILALQAAI